MGRGDYQEILEAADFVEGSGGQWTREARTCSKCGKEFLNPVVRERHEERCEGVVEVVEDRGTFYCTYEGCGTVFGSKQALSAHEISHRRGTCQWCGEEWVLTGLGIHEAACEKNPNRGEWLKGRKGHCPHCDKKMLLSSINYHVEHNCPVAKYKRENEVRIEGPTTLTSPLLEKVADHIQAQSVTLEDSITEEIYEVLDLLLPDGFRARFTPDVVEWAESTANLIRKIREGQ